MQFYLRDVEDTFILNSNVIYTSLRLIVPLENQSLRFLSTLDFVIDVWLGDNIDTTVFAFNSNKP